MTEAEASELPLLDIEGGQPIARLRIVCRAGHLRRQGLSLIEVADEKNDIHLLEESEYRYSVDCDSESVALEPRELFDSDDATGKAGRLKTGPYVGSVSVRMKTEKGAEARNHFRIRSSKISYDVDFRRMLSSIAEEGAELIMQRFSPASGTFTSDVFEDGRLLYQRFAFLQTMLEEESFEAAIQQILHRPIIVFEGELEARPSGRGIKGSSSVSRQLTRGGPRTDAPYPGFSGGGLPTKLDILQFEVSTDNEANQFVKFVLQHWSSTCRELYERLAIQPRNQPVERGLRESLEIMDKLDGILGHPLFQEIGELQRVPFANQALLKREGYREILRMFSASEAAARFSWDGAEDVFRAGQRDAATLYEYWVYLQLRRILSGFCSRRLTLEPFTEFTPDGLGLRLKKGKAQMLTGSLERKGRLVSLELWFNKSFKRESWSRNMKPDCSIRILADPGYRKKPVETWLHFDAKYRIETITELFGTSEEHEELVQEKREDLLKMHAYRDAIRRSAGAYVIYPGQERGERTFPQYEEILPGLGAFPLRPGMDGNSEPLGESVLTSFIDRILDHVALQGSRRERGDYWREEANSDNRPRLARAAHFLSKPPADTPVLLGYVKSAAHLEWIRRTQIYNLRADDRSGSVGVDPSGLAAEFVLLYGSFEDPPILVPRMGNAILLTGDELAKTGYPSPAGRLYCCLEVGRPLSEFHEIGSHQFLLALAQRLYPSLAVGAPIVITWSSLSEEVLKADDPTADDLIRHS